MYKCVNIIKIKNHTVGYLVQDERKTEIMPVTIQVMKAWVDRQIVRNLKLTRQGLIPTDNVAAIDIVQVLSRYTDAQDTDAIIFLMNYVIFRESCNKHLTTPLKNLGGKFEGYLASKFGVTSLQLDLPNKSILMSQSKQVAKQLVPVLTKKYKLDDTIAYFIALYYISINISEHYFDDFSLDMVNTMNDVVFKKVSRTHSPVSYKDEIMSILFETTTYNTNFKFYQ